jgi:tRNA(Ile)-lysidine synthase TilS/MesJ
VGVFIGAWCKGYPGIDDPLIFWSTSDAVLFAQAQNFSWISIESDCWLWKTRKIIRPVISPLLEDVSDLSLSFQTFDVFVCSSLFQ